jgi:hypothetical protein
MKKLFLIMLAVASLGACKKDSENTPSKTDLLTSKKWRVTAYSATYTASGGSAPITTTVDQYAQTTAYSKDDFYKFNTDKTLTVDEGPTKYSTSSPQTTAYTWDFNSGQTKLLISPVGAGTTSITISDIVELSATTLHIRGTDSYMTGTTTTLAVSDITFTSF